MLPAVQPNLPPPPQYRQPGDSRSNCPSSPHASTRVQGSSRILWLAFAAPQAWLITCCEQNAHHIRNNHPDNTDLTKIHLAKKLLAASSGIKGLRIELVLPRAPRECGGSDVDSDGCLPVLVSVCSSMRSSFVNRPSKSQLEKLKSIMGGREPDWYVDAHLPSHYSED